MNPFRRLLHRRCDAAIDGLAEAADDQTYRAETVEADLHTAEHEVHQVREDLMCAEHDLEQAHQRLRGLRGQFEQVLEHAYEAGMLYRTWALLDSSLDADSRAVLDTAAWTARIPALEGLTRARNSDGFWGSASAPEQCVDPFCRREQGLVVVRHSAAEDRARMVCTACGRHWGLPRYLAPTVEQMVSTFAGTGGGTRTPIREVPWQVLAAADAALPPA